MANKKIRMDDSVGCGIKFIWAKPNDISNDIFSSACQQHDQDYDSKISGAQTLTLKEIDDNFLANMLSVAETRFDKARAYFYYGLARIWGLTVRRKLWE